MIFTPIQRGFLKGLQITYDIGKIIIPIYIILGFLEAIGILEYIALIAEPLMALVGLPGEMSLALVLGNVLNIYAAIGVIISVGITTKQVTITAVMLLISHSLPMELAVTKKTGVPILGIGFLRLGVAFISGILLNLIM